MIIDLHSHTHYSHCGRDNPEVLVQEMIRQGVQVLGVTDHNYGIRDNDCEEGSGYRAAINFLKEKYADQIQIFCAIEVCTLPQYAPKRTDFSAFAYALVENLDDASSVTKGDLIAYTSGFGCSVGIAHTDLFKMIKEGGRDALNLLSTYAKHGIFWELNVNFDSIHGYREHAYVKEFMQSREQQELVRQSGLHISIGFDGHRLEDYDVARVREGNEFLAAHNLPNAVELLK